ncbi:hypothetical protein EC80586_2586, partial [Escherichia coli 8.0586]
AQIPT